VCVVGLKKAFMPATEKAQEIFNDPANLPLRTVLAEYPVSVPHDGSAILQQRRRTEWLANGCHPLALLVAVAGPIAAITIQRNSLDDSVCILDFRNGALGNLHGTRSAARSQPSERYTFFGNNCTLA
jgi:predicted dehydrogenase